MGLVFNTRETVYTEPAYDIETYTKPQNFTLPCDISGFRRSAVEVFALLECLRCIGW
jgi:hypothetical protein